MAVVLWVGTPRGVPYLSAQAPSPKTPAVWSEATSGYTYALPRDHDSHPE